MSPAPDRLRYRWVVLAAATLTQMGTAFAFLGVGALAAHFRAEFDLDGARTGLIVTAVALAPLFVMIPVGRMLDRRSETVIMTVGALLLAAGIVAASFASSYPLLLFILFCGGAGYATSQPGGSKVVAHWFEARQRGLAMGIRQTGLPLGGAAAAAVLPRLAGTHSLGVALQVAAGVVAGAAVTFALVNRPHGVRGPRDRPRIRQDVGALLRVPAFRRLLAIGIVMVSAQLVIIVHLMSFLFDTKGIALVDGAWVLFAAQAAGVPGRIVLARWSDRRSGGRTMPMAMALIVTSVAVLAIPAFGGSFAAWLFLGAATGFFAFGWYGPWVVAVAETGSPTSMGTTLAVAMTGNQLAIVFAPPLFGLIVDVTGTWTPAWVLLSLAVAAVALWVRRPLPHGQQAGPPS